MNLAKRILLMLVVCSCALLSACESVPHGEPGLLENTQLQLVDWHITGLWVINCPVAWVKVWNNNSVPIKEITFQYNTYDASGQALDQGTFTIDGEVQPGQMKNFIELYLGVVSLYSERLSIKLISVSRG